MKVRGTGTGAGYFAVSLLLAALLPTLVWATKDESLDNAAADPVRIELQRVLDDRALPGRVTQAEFAALEDFYRRRNYQPAWCHAGGVDVDAQQWLAYLTRAAGSGPDAPDAQLAVIQPLLNATAPRECALLDLLLSDSFISHVQTVSRTALMPASLPEDGSISRPAVEPAQLLEQALQSGQFAEALARLEPRHPAYLRLREQLDHYQALQARGGWPAFAASGARLEPGARSDELPRLRQLLTVTGDLVLPSMDGMDYDAELEGAVRRFQQRHGLTVDGIIGKATRAALAVPVEQRIAQLRVNLERWRWLPRDLGERYILVNSAAFELQAHAGDQVPLSMRVIVGKRERETPEFTEKMRYLVVNPYWRVPTKIAREDLIPALLRDRDYFARKGIRVLSGWGADAQEVDADAVAWPDYLSEKRYLPYQLRQDPGPRNSLGRIKFMLPNQHSIYLHDTPSRNLFKRTERAFSSGCVRVEDPLALATWVLGDTPDRRAQIEALLDAGDTRTVPLPEPLPVYVLYHTAWVDEAGNVHFRKDIYQRDPLLLTALAASERAAVEPPEVKIPAASDAVRLAQRHH